MEILFTNTNTVRLQLRNLKREETSWKRIIQEVMEVLAVEAATVVAAVTAVAAVVAAVATAVIVILIIIHLPITMETNRHRNHHHQPANLQAKQLSTLTVLPPLLLPLKVERK